MFRYIAEDIAFLLIKNKIVDIEKRDECVYGAEVLLLNLSNILTALIISVLTKSMLHFAAFMLIFVPLRIFIGGFHAKTSEICYLITSAIYALTVLCVKLMPDLYSNIPAIITLAVLIVPIVLFAPVEHKNNSLSKDERKRNRLISIVLTAVDFLIFVTLFILSISTATTLPVHSVLRNPIMNTLFRAWAMPKSAELSTCHVTSYPSSSSVWRMVSNVLPLSCDSKPGTFSRSR